VWRSRNAFDLHNTLLEPKPAAKAENHAEKPGLNIPICREAVAVKDRVHQRILEAAYRQIGITDCQ
jgi:hypothetical protein